MSVCKAPHPSFFRENRVFGLSNIKDFNVIQNGSRRPPYVLGNVDEFEGGLVDPNSTVKAPVAETLSVFNGLESQEYLDEAHK